MGLASKVSEYFLGTETHKMYARQREFYQEFIIDQPEQRRAIVTSYALEGLHLFLGKLIPTMAAVSGIVYSVLQKEPRAFGPVVIVAGEFSRYIMGLLFSGNEVLFASEQRRALESHTLDDKLNL